MGRHLSEIKSFLCSALLVSALLFVTAHCNAELASGGWPKFRGNVRNTGLGVNKGPAGGDVDWAYLTGGEILTSPSAAANGMIYAVSRDQHLYALNPDGTMAWRYDINAGAGASSPAIGSDGTIYVGSDDYSLYAVNPDGTLKWRKGFGAAIQSSPSVWADGTIYFGANNYRVHALNPDGSTKWTYATGNPISSSPAIGSDGTVYVASRDRYLYALNPTGTFKWRVGMAVGSESSPAVGTDGTVYLGSDDGKLYAVSGAGTLLWSYTIGAMVKASPAIGPGGVIYVGSDNGYLYAVRPDGTLNWRYQTGGPIRSSAAVGSDGIIYFGSQDRFLYSLNPDGTLRWRHETGGQVSSSPAIGPGGQLYVGSLDRKIYAFKSDQTPPTTPVVTDDGIYSTSPDTLHAAWSAADPETGVAEYQYAIGTQPGLTDTADWTSAGTAVEVTREGLNLVSGVTYCISVKARNGAGMWSDIGWSDGILVEYTPPSPPLVVDDGAFSASPDTLHASWSASDAETGVVEYEYSIGTGPGLSDAAPWTPAGTSSDITRSGLALGNGVTYYFAVKARNAAGLWSAVGTSDGIKVDLTPPDAPVVADDGEFTSITSTLHASWTSQDPESGVVEYEYAIGTAPSGTDISNWTSAGAASEVTAQGLSLPDGITCYISVRARNAVSMWGAPGSSDGITVDLSAPTAPIVTDDGSATSSPDTLHASWSSADALSGVVEYRYAIGTTRGATDVVTWTSVGAATEVTLDGLTLFSGNTYYFAVEARNGAGLWSNTGTSDGILVDLSAPAIPVVTDDGAFTTSSDTLHALWESADAETGVAGYEYAIGAAPGSTDIVPWTSTGTATEVTRSGLTLANGGMFYFAVRARNAVGLWSASGISDGILVDNTPPAGPDVTDGGDFTCVTDSLHASWTSTDTESGVSEYRYAVGTTAGGTEIAGWISAGTSTEAKVNDLSLSDGATYFVSVRARNEAGLWSATGSSDGITIDLSPPSAPTVTDDGETTYSFDTLYAAWASSDEQSGIVEYQYAIGTLPGSADVADWTSAGSASEVTRTGLALTDEVPYYFTVKARNRAGLWGEVGVSDGIVCAAASVWPKFRGDAVNSGVSDYAGSRTGALLWQFPTFGWVESSPAIGGDGTVYIGSGDGTLYAIRRNGTLQWLFGTGGPVDSSPAIGRHGEIYVGSYDGNLYCLAPNGTLKWSYRTGDMIWSSPVIGPDGTVYVGSQDGFVYAIRPDGTLGWRFDAGGAVWSSPALSDGGVLYFGSNDGNLYAVNASDGQMTWSYRTGTAIDSSPSIAPDGTVYAGSGDSYFYAFRPDGTLKWRFFTGLPTDSSASIGPDGTVYVGAGHSWVYGEVYALNPNGTQKWRYQVGGAVRSSPAIDADGSLYFGTGDGYVYSLTSAGALRWKFYTGAAVLSSPAIHRDGTVCIGSFTGAVYAFKDSDISDDTPPTKPVVVDEGAGTLSADALSASWSATDPESGIEEYWYALGTWPGTEDVAPWTQMGTATSVALSDLSLVAGKTYYFSVKARNSARIWSQIGVSDGIVAVSPGMVKRIGTAEHLEDNTLVYLSDAVVTARYADCFYIEEADRSAGIKVVPNGLPMPEESSKVSLAGSVTSVNGEAAIRLTAVAADGTVSIPRPIGIIARTMCAGLQADYRPGSPAPTGLDAIGLLVTVRGRVTMSQPDCFYVDDCSGAIDPSGAAGVKVAVQNLAPTRTIAVPPPGTWIRVTGILASEPVNGVHRSVLRPRSQTDVSRL